MSNLQRPVTGGLFGSIALGTSAAVVSGQRRWLVITTIATALIGSLALLLSLIAKRSSK